MKHLEGWEPLAMMLILVAVAAVAAVTVNDFLLPPAVPHELRAKLWRAQAEANAAQIALEKSAEAARVRETQHALGDLVRQLETHCGTKYQPGADAAGEPVCIAKPPAPPAAAPKPTPK